MRERVAPIDYGGNAEVTNVIQKQSRQFLDMGRYQKLGSVLI